MSPDLPTRPNLERLKKQAKERLRELKVRVPDAQLADAQHAIAREYGFASWPRLKAHIEALTSTRPRPTTGRHAPATGWPHRMTLDTRAGLAAAVV